MYSFAVPVAQWPIYTRGLEWGWGGAGERLEWGWGAAGERLEKSRTKLLLTNFLQELHFLAFVVHAETLLEFFRGSQAGVQRAISWLLSGLGLEIELHVVGLAEFVFCRMLGYVRLILLRLAGA